MKYSIFIPCYNEEACIYANAEKVVKVMRAFTKSFEVIIVNDCSTDNTIEQAMMLKNKYKQVRLINWNGPKPTRRENLMQSFEEANGEIIAYLDADLSTDLNGLELLLLCAEFYGVCIGNRYHKNSKIVRSKKRFIISKLMNALTRVLFQTGINDHFIGFKAFRKELLMEATTSMFNENAQRSMWWDAELLIRIKKLIKKYPFFRINDMPVIWTESRWSKLNVKRDIKMLIYLLKFRIKLWINKI